MEQTQFSKKAIIIGAGPAGLTAGYELLKNNTGIQPIIIELSTYMGGISRTINYKGNRIDIGGHRFFSKSDIVMDWWMNMMPLEQTGNHEEEIFYQGQSRQVKIHDGVDSTQTDEVMLIRNRKSRIYFLRKFFDYPIKLSAQTISNLGFLRISKIGLSYIHNRLFPIPKEDEKTLEQFFINRFGQELYLTFFKSYTEKVWGVPCNQINADWGAQRIKGLSISTALKDFFKKTFSGGNKANTDIRQKGTETSLIEKFMYPKLGPGQMWETCAKKITDMGGQILTRRRCVKWLTDENTKLITGVEILNLETQEVETYTGDYFFSTVPMKELIRTLQYPIPEEVKTISEGLVYRDFITVGLLCNDLKIKDKTPEGEKLVTDNWIYIQEPDVKVGRLQIFNNWSPALVADPTKVWIGLEYFVNEGDEIWNLSQEDMIQLGKDELDKINILDKTQVIDATVIKVPKTYPAYFGTYDQFDGLKDWINQFENLFLVGRNGMHRYNNQDHSMLTAIYAVENIINGVKTKDNIWSINAEQEYHETAQKK
jgi:protoporphyrinogen oxidase